MNPNTKWVPKTWETEWRVNAIWNRAITRAAVNRPFNNGNLWYIHSPEARSNDTNGKKADLATFIAEDQYNQQVYQGSRILSSPVITFEGKGGNSKDKFTQISTQINTWCVENPYIGYEAVAASSRPCWAIGARGAYVKFWLFSKNPHLGNNKLLPIRVNGIAGGNFSIEIMYNAGVNDGPEFEWETAAVDFVVNIMVDFPWAQNVTGTPDQGGHW